MCFHSVNHLLHSMYFCMEQKRYACYYIGIFILVNMNNNEIEIFSNFHKIVMIFTQCPEIDLKGVYVMINPIRVLQIVTIMNRGGLETMLMNYYRNVDRQQIQFDFMSHRSERGIYDDEIEALGGKIFRMPPIHPKNFFGDNGYFKKLDIFFKNHKEYKIVHSHLESLSPFVLRYAKNNGVPVRIAHSHSTNLASKGIKKIFKIYSQAILYNECTDFFACGEEAGKFLFKKAISQGRDFVIMKNAIDTDKFKFDNTIRKKVRQRFNFEAKFVVGHIGSFSEPKNHAFLIDIFYEIQKAEPNSALFLIGDGPLIDRIKNKAEQLGISDKIIFTGVVANVNEMLMAMDVFLLPSLYEGLPVVCIEAQAAGLPIITSSNVSKEAMLTNLMAQIDLQSDAAFWAKKVLLHKNTPRDETANEKVRKVYGIRENANWLQRFYLNAINEHISN